MDADNGAEVLYDSDRTRVTRVHLAGGVTIVRKQPLGVHAAARLRNELSALELLREVPGVVRLGPAGDPAVSTTLDSGTALTDLPMPWPVGPLIELAYALAQTLAAVHRHGVIHRDVSPANIVIDADGRPTLIDFELAVLPAQDRSAPVPAEEMAGTLPYLAPEQTGRTGRPVDHRADLYALGATLYELATGTPPFGRDREPLALIHDHLARLPAAPAERVPQLPVALSEILLRLLDKEPDHRYQSGEGLAHDLALLRERLAGGATGAFPLGDRDFPLRLAPPAELIGRDTPLAALHALLTEARTARSALAFLTGAPGVGKTALVERLRPAVAAAGGRFVTGKSDQYQHERGGGDSVRDAFEQLGAQLLAEPDAVVADLRERLVAALGPDHRLVASVLPAFGALFGVEPDAALPEPQADPQTVFTRLAIAAGVVLRIVATGASPTVMFLDDLQWAGPGAFRFLDDVRQRDLPGLLVLGAYREDRVDEVHPLGALHAQLRVDRGAAAEIVLENLGPGDLATLVARMLRIPPDRASPLAAVLAGHTGGNPFDTVELLNALRRESLLVPYGAGWVWNDESVRQFVGVGDVAGLINARIDALPPQTRELIDVMTCLGAEVEAGMLPVAWGRPAEQVEAALRPAADEGLLVSGPATVRFAHDRIQQAAFGRLGRDRHAALSLDLARRIAADPHRQLAAAPYYLAGSCLLATARQVLPGEPQAVADLLRRAAGTARRLANQAVAERYLAVAARLQDPAGADHVATLAEWHAVLAALGRFDDADRLFTDILATGPDPIQLAGPVTEQIGALIHRRMLSEALALGLGALARLGLPAPDPDRLQAVADAALSEFQSWLATAGDPGELPELTDPRLLAIARVADLLMTVAYLVDRPIMAWAVAESARIWATEGVCEVLAGPLAHISPVLIGRDRGDNAYHDAYLAVRHVLATCRARGYETGYAHAEYMHAIVTAYWFEPLEQSVRMAQQARDGLLRAGDARHALYTYYASVPQLLGCADLYTVDRETDAAIALAERLGAVQESATFTAFTLLIRTVRDGDDFAGLDEDGYLTDMAEAFSLSARMVAAAVLGDDATLARYGARAVRLLAATPGSYVTATVHVLAVLGARARAHAAAGADREQALADLDRGRDFLAARAADQPGSYRHLHRLAEATRAAAHGEFAAAIRAYDLAIADTETLGPSWHRPLILERAARFYLDHGLDQVGNRLLAEAASGYAAWGADAKVRRLGPFHSTTTSHARRTTTGGTHSASLSAEDVDLMAVLEAARALSSETNPAQLRARVQMALGQLTGATAVQVLIRDDAGGWLLPGDGDRPDLTAAEAARHGLVPLAAVRYAERTGEPMIVDDVSRDDRVVRDPYCAGLEHCSLLAVPVLHHGEARAMLLLENRLNRHAFSSGRLDTVRLVAGQLAVSLEIAQASASLEGRIAARTEELAEANRRLELLTVTDALTGLPNRRKLTAFLDDEWLRASRGGYPIAVAMIDIDNFKKYNDRYGHQAGDRCLHRVAQALRGAVRATDLVARYGGEEFSIVMPATGLDHALLVAERARQSVHGLAEPHALNEGGVVTISAGVTSGVPAVVADPDQLTKLADEALYRAKDEGRNRVASG